MKQLNIFCEGITEQIFCQQVFQPHLFPQGDGLIHTLAVGEVNHHHIYGIGRRTKYAKIKKFILNTMKGREGKNVYFTTFFDLYALPTDFPGQDQFTLNPADPTPYVEALETELSNDIGHHRFIPHLQLYEFETMLFADPQQFEIAFEDCQAEIDKLKLIAESEPSIEHINDGKETAPSKRIIAVIPEYDGRKATAGPDIAEFIGLDVIRQKCSHFDRWVTSLETIPWESEELGTTAI